MQVDSYTAVLNHQVQITRIYWVSVTTSIYYNKCTFKIEINNIFVKIVSMYISVYGYFPVAKISAVNSCRVKINLSGISLYGFILYSISNLGQQ